MLGEKLRDEWSANGQIITNLFIPGRMEIIFEDPAFIDIVTYQKDVINYEEVNEESKSE